ncbi:hypothetical protein IEQ34_018733 [Dendrobium chrysotoxum]|uniref:Uncharacterized protein n=1 Tax=Dendrobium chrysotoxum TaxID=161865 RepID=A0AAV7G621_DENCH|nr:hypothetical protein IEQ34_018733 [Dendrobium chrysotoxum]
MCLSDLRMGYISYLDSKEERTSLKGESSSVWKPKAGYIQSIQREKITPLSRGVSFYLDIRNRRSKEFQEDEEVKNRKNPKSQSHLSLRSRIWVVVSDTDTILKNIVIARTSYLFSVTTKIHVLEVRGEDQECEASQDSFRLIDNEVNLGQVIIGQVTLDSSDNKSGDDKYFEIDKVTPAKKSLIELPVLLDLTRLRGIYLVPASSLSAFRSNIAIGRSQVLDEKSGGLR